MIFHGCFLSNGAMILLFNPPYSQFSVLLPLLAVRPAQREESLPHGSSLPLFHEHCNHDLQTPALDAYDEYAPILDPYYIWIGRTR